MNVPPALPGRRFGGTRLLLLPILWSALPTASPLHAATALSQYGITWTFDHDYSVGQFANGDYWVVGPVTIMAITPGVTMSGADTLNGSMVNPVVNGPQGYDSRIKYNTYSAALDVGTALPITLLPGSSLLSSQSIVAPAVNDDPQLQTIAILTVLASPAPPGSFRPPPVGTDKTLLWNTSQLDYSRLQSLPLVSSTPALSSVEAEFARPWIEQGTTWISRYLHPAGNQPAYGREIAHGVAEGMLSLQLNYSNAQKQALLIRLVQYGLDVYGSARLGGVWAAGGAHDQGRKLPLLLAGMVLGDPAILSYGNGQKLIFQEDQQTWYVSASDVGRPLYQGDGRPRVPYIAADVGLAEWGEKHAIEPQYDGRNWDTYYRTVSGSCTIGHALAARLMGLDQIWNWPALFDYYDRYWALESSDVGPGPNLIQPFVASMWIAYRNTPPVGGPIGPVDVAPNPGGDPRLLIEPARYLRWHR